MFTTDHTENIKDVIRKIIEAICVEEWLDDEDGFKLLHGIFILYHKDGRFSYAHSIFSPMHKLSRCFPTTRCFTTTRLDRNVENDHYRDDSVNSLNATPE